MLSKTENVHLKLFLENNQITQNEFDILFCSKNDWFTIDKDGKQDWSKSLNNQLAFFWETIEKIKLLFENKDLFPISDINNYDFSFIQFPPIQIHKSIMKKVAFNDPLSIFSKYRNSINFYKAKFYGDFTVNNSSFDIALNFENCTFLGNTIFKNVTFNKKEVFKKSIFKKSIIFDNVNFNDITIFKSATFEDDVIFRGVTFNEWASFKDISSNQKLDFRYSRTKDFIDFSSSKICYIDLEHTRFNSAGFLNLNGINVHKEITVLNKSNFANKESARLIKAHFEKENNISEANKYFQIEQDLYLDELKNKTSLEANKEITKFVLRLNKYVSDYGTNWVKPLLVMLIFGFVAGLGYSFLENGNKEINFSDKKEWLSIGIIYSILIYYFYHKKIWVALTASIIVFLSVLMGDLHLREIGNHISTLINPLNIFKPKANYFESIALYGMLVKFSMSVLIYQFIMAFRQNTRRK